MNRGWNGSPDNAGAHAIDCGWIQSSDPWALCTCGVGSPNNLAPPAHIGDEVEEAAYVRGGSAGEPVAAIRDRARWFVRDFSREVGFAMSEAQTEIMLNLFLRYADPIPVSSQELIDRVFKCVTEWVNDKNIPFDDQNALFRGLAYDMNPFEQKFPEDFVKDRKDAEAIRAFFGNARTSTNVAEQNAALPASTNRLTDEQILAIAWKYHYDEPDASGYDFGTPSLLEFARAIIAATEAK